MRHCSRHLIALIASCTFTGAAHAGGYYVTGTMLNRFIEAGERVRAGSASAEDIGWANYGTGYIAALADVGDGVTHCTGNKVTVDEVKAVVAKHLREHPDEWDAGAEHLAIRAMHLAYPCPRR